MRLDVIAHGCNFSTHRVIGKTETRVSPAQQQPARDPAPRWQARTDTPGCCRPPCRLWSAHAHAQIHKYAHTDAHMRQKKRGQYVENRMTDTDPFLQTGASWPLWIDTSVLKFSSTLFFMGGEHKSLRDGGNILCLSFLTGKKKEDISRAYMTCLWGVKDSFMWAAITASCME